MSLQKVDSLREGIDPVPVFVAVGVAPTENEACGARFAEVVQRLGGGVGVVQRPR